MKRVVRFGDHLAVEDTMVYEDGTPVPPHLFTSLRP
jgi:hypothetical protein